MKSWLVAIHIIGVILWMGGLFMNTRHSGMLTDMDDVGDLPQDLIDFEWSSYYFAVLPGFLLAAGTGFYLLLSNAGWYLNADGAWGPTFHIKLTLVGLLIAVDQFYHYKMRQLHREREGNKGLFMMLHGVSGLLFIAIVLTVFSMGVYHG
jgi:uncharacterized membrane protein